MTTTDVTSSNTTVERLHFRKSIPKEHQQNLDTRIQWLWNQRFGTVQTIAMESADLQDKTACTLFLQAIMGGDLDSIALILRRLEGGPQADEEVLERATLRV
jgi:hypothetical protein